MFNVEDFRVLFITYDVDDKLMLCKTTLHGYNKLARDKAHDICGPVLEHSKNVGRFLMKSTFKS